LSLTGTRLKAGDLLQYNLATHYLVSSLHPDLINHNYEEFTNLLLSSSSSFPSSDSDFDLVMHNLEKNFNAMHHYESNRLLTSSISQPSKESEKEGEVSLLLTPAAKEVISKAFNLNEMNSLSQVCDTYK
jgi:hypothetical protein